jgi:hypothetical protein
MTRSHFAHFPSILSAANLWFVAGLGLVVSDFNIELTALWL